MSSRPGAAREDLEAAAMSVAASVTKTWVSILALHHEISILKDQIEANRKLLDLQELRYSNGKSSALDVSQQRETLASSRAELPLKELSIQTLKNSLAVLLGKASGQQIKVEQTRLPVLIPLPQSGLPADLLASRPDVRAAGLRVGSADWDVSTARANRLPKLNLSAGSALNAASSSLFFENWLLSLAASLTGPLFDGGAPPGRSGAHPGGGRGKAEFLCPKPWPPRSMRWKTAWPARPSRKNIWCFWVSNLRRRVLP